MLYREGPFRREAYREHRWRVTPADMVTEFLRRDLAKRVSFGRFFPLAIRRTPVSSLTGGLEEFSEVDDGEHRKAVLAATITLLDLSVREIPGRVVFQKTYRCEATSRRGGTRTWPRQ